MISDVGDRVTSRQRVVRRGRFGLRGTREENTSSLNKRGCLMLRVEPGRTHGRAGAFPGRAVCASDASQQLDAQRRVRAPGRAGHPGMGALGRAAPRGHVGGGRAGTRKQRPVPEERARAENGRPMSLSSLVRVLGCTPTWVSVAALGTCAGHHWGLTKASRCPGLGLCHPSVCGGPWVGAAHFWVTAPPPHVLCNNRGACG